ncbi:hypothetical protein A2U01_0042261, partial [Trifolium medium]|nr:hypothetical protein [Trifolium medium]
MYVVNQEVICGIIKVVRTGPDWPVGPGTGHASGSVSTGNRGAGEPGENRANR